MTNDLPIRSKSQNPNNDPNLKSCSGCKMYFPLQNYIWKVRSGIDKDHKTCKRCHDLHTKNNKIYKNKYVNNEKLKLYFKEKITCTCGVIISRGSMYTHKNSKTHAERLANLQSTTQSPSPIDDPKN